MNELFKNDEFAQYILSEYFSEQNMTDEEKIEQVSSTLEEFNIAMDCFKLTSSTIRSH